MHWSFYLRKGIAYIPTTAKTGAGYWMAIEPVDVAPVRNVDELQRLLAQAVGRGNPVIKTPTCGNEVLSAFERTAALWAIWQRDGSYVICPYRRSVRYRGTWEEDAEERTLLPLSIPFEEVVRKAAERAFNETWE